MKVQNSYNNAYFLTLTDEELIKFCKNVPKDCEFIELKIASDILADRYESSLDFIRTIGEQLI